MKSGTVAILVAALLLARASTGQTFQNLDFDSASPISMSTTVADALPGWNAYVGGVRFDQAFYNTIPLDASYVGVFDGNAPSYMPSPLFHEGFGAVLAAGLGGDVWLTQTGRIPAGPSSISFWTTGPTGYTTGQHDNTVGFAINGESIVAINGQNAALTAVDYEGEWTRWSADISAFAGTIAEIRFSLSSYYIPGTSGAYEMYLDDVDITGFPVPEPATIVLISGCVALLITCRECRSTIRKRIRGNRSHIGSQQSF